MWIGATRGPDLHFSLISFFAVQMKKAWFKHILFLKLMLQLYNDMNTK